MDSTTAVVIIVVIFAVVVLAALWRYRRQGEASIEVGGARVHVKGANEPEQTPLTQPVISPAQPQGGARIRDVEAGKNVSAQDTTGEGASVERAKASGSISAVSEDPKA